LLNRFLEKNGTRLGGNGIDNLLILLLLGALEYEQRNRTTG